MKSLKELTEDLKEKILVDLDEEVKQIASAIWPEDIGTKEWFQRYVREVASHDLMPEDKKAEIFQGLKKFDPKFAELCKKANDTAVDLITYAQKRMENK